MRRTVRRGAKFAILIFTLMFFVAACSIQAPNVILSGGSNTGGGGGTNLPGDTGGGGTGGGTGGTGGGTGGTGGGTGGTGGSVPNASDTSCVGKATATGVTATQIKLGSTFAYSGPVSNISGPILKGVQSYFNKVNAEGGIFGRKIFLKWYDDGWDAQKGKAFIKKLVEQDKVAFLSVVPSSNGLDAATSYLESKNMPVIGTSGLIESQFKSSMQWPVGTSTRSASRIQLLDLKKRGVTSLAVVWLDLLAGAEAFDALQKGVPQIFGVPAKDFITADRRVSISEADFGPVWAEIQSDTASWQKAHNKPATGRPDYVVLAIDPTNAVKALQAAQAKGFKPNVGWGGGQPLFLNVLAANGYARATHLFAGSSYFPPQMAAQIPAVAEYVKTVQKYYGSSVDVTNPFLEGGYAGAALTVEAIKRSGSCLTKDKVIAVANSLSGFSAAGLTRPLTYSKGNHYGNINYLAAQVQENGTWKVVTDWIADPTPGR